jgi:hypothetical protein
MPSRLAAALCAALSFPALAARAQDLPEPVSRTVIEPPTSSAAPDPAADHPGGRPPTLGFQLRAGSAEVDRLILGASFGGGPGPLTLGLSGDVTLDARGAGHRGHRDRADDGRGWSDWCTVRSDGRCLDRADLSLSIFGGLRHRTAPFLGGSRLRLELVGEVGWQASVVEERISGASTTSWSDAGRAYPFAGARAVVGLTFLERAYLGVGAYARQGLAGKLCVTTDGGCTRVGGGSAGALLVFGADWQGAE